MKTRTRLGFLLLVACGCHDVLDEGPDSGSPPDSATTLLGTCGPEHTLHTAVLDTSNPAVWVYYDLDTAALVTEHDGWDLRMRLKSVHTNGGVTGTGGVEVAVVDGAWDSFEDRCQAPSSGFAPDASHGGAFSGSWEGECDYHCLYWPADRMYYVLTTDGAYHRLRLDWYDLGYYGGGTEYTLGFTHGAIIPP